jgi:hypothetical protein
MNIVFGLIAAALFAVFIYVAAGVVRTSHSGARRIELPFGRTEKAYPKRRSPFRATSIVGGGSTCSAVKRLLHVKFLDLDNRLPALPVPGCNLGYCNCKYVHHADRRESDIDRRSPHTLTSELYDRSGKINRRVSKGGRRRGDLNRVRIRYSFDDPQLQG